MKFNPECVKPHACSECDDKCVNKTFLSGLPEPYQQDLIGRSVHKTMRKGDYVFIAQRMESSVIICGEVKNPHKRLFEAGMGLIEFLTAAGWMKDSHWSHVIIIRDGLSHPKLYKVDVDGILAGKCRNVLLKAGDIVYVPKDDLSEYNVFVNKLMPTAQLFNLIAGRANTFGMDRSNKD